MPRYKVIRFYTVEETYEVEIPAFSSKEDEDRQAIKATRETPWISKNIINVSEKAVYLYSDAEITEMAQQWKDEGSSLVEALRHFRCLTNNKTEEIIREVYSQK